MPDKDDEESDSSESPGSGRPIWSGTISFGLVSIPVTLAPAVRDDRVHLRMLDKDGTPLARRYYCSKDDKEVPPNHLIRGFEIEKDTYIPITDQELESLEPEKSRDIDLRLFVDEAAVDPIYFEKPYFLVPNKESTKAYRLLVEGMEKTKRAGIATFVMRDKEYLVAIISETGILRAETMRFSDEVRSPEEMELPKERKASPSHVQQMEKAIGSLTKEEFNPDSLEREYNKKLLKLIERKKDEGEDLVTAEVSEAADDEGSGRVINLMAALQESLEKARKTQKGNKIEKDSARPTRKSRMSKSKKAHPGSPPRRSRTKRANVKRKS